MNKQELIEVFDEAGSYGSYFIREQIEQLDEPKTLSPDWIEDHQEMVVLINKGYDKYGNVYSAGSMVKGVQVEKLENLLVPKQPKDNVISEVLEESIDELIRLGNLEKEIEKLTDMTLEEIKEEARNGGIVPKQDIGALEEEWLANTVENGKLSYYGTKYNVVKQGKVKVPEFVGEWIEENKEIGYTIQQVFYIVHWSYKDNDMNKAEGWISDNNELFARAWLDGYEVEEEQKYYALTKGGVLLLLKTLNGVAETNYALSWVTDEIRENYQLTEQEIKDYDERYFQFAIPVEEVNADG